MATGAILAYARIPCPIDLLLGSAIRVQMQNKRREEWTGSEPAQVILGTDYEEYRSVIFRIFGNSDH